MGFSYETADAVGLCVKFYRGESTLTSGGADCGDLAHGHWRGFCSRSAADHVDLGFTQEYLPRRCVEAHICQGESEA
ncbi:MAG: hypothetical protein AUK47_14235 [Deltaproteobacteria bacterium CG2_30_63_29]|nr:MAG: hypothetical protein AUK47_14235 [Deltaproteobacteria bacterium CG2_30_63_29]PJB37665.1 MAG: hypothetical protein CO108_20645 [Deltaproteobacteria bacterium CG_4_9_14_3_um_filter_63_12]